MLIKERAALGCWRLLDFNEIISACLFLCYLLRMHMTDFCRTRPCILMLDSAKRNGRVSRLINKRSVLKNNC